MVVLFDWARSFGRDAHGVVREEGDTRLASQIRRINPGDQWGDRCHNQVALTSRTWVQSLVRELRSHLPRRNWAQTRAEQSASRNERSRCNTPTSPRAPTKTWCSQTKTRNVKKKKKKNRNKPNNKQSLRQGVGHRAGLQYTWFTVSACPDFAVFFCAPCPGSYTGPVSSLSPLPAPYRWAVRVPSPGPLLGSHSYQCPLNSEADSAKHQYSTASISWVPLGKTRCPRCSESDTIWTRREWVERASLVAQSVRNLPAMQETQVRFLGQEDPLEKEMATHSSILAWRIPWTEEPGGLQSMGSQHDLKELDTTWQLNHHHHSG